MSTGFENSRYLRIFKFLYSVKYHMYDSDEVRSLIETGALYKFITEQAPIGIGISDFEGNVIFYNKKIAEILGYTPVELKQVDMRDTFLDVRDREKSLRELLEKGRVVNLEIQRKRKDGTTCYTLTNIELAKLNNKPYILNLTLDITDRKEAEDLYRLLFESAPIGIGTSNEEGKILTCNQKMLEIMGLTDLDTNEVNLLNTYADPNQREQLMKELRISGRVKNVELQRIQPDGSEYSILTNTEKIVHFKNEEVFLTTALDITDRKKVEIMRVELEQQRQRFIEIATHELKNPISSIKGAIDAIQLIHPELKENQFVDIIGRNIKKLEILTKGISDIYKFERGVFELNKEVVDFCDFLQGEVLSFQILLGSSFIFHSCDHHGKILVEMDKDRISQVLANLVDNAVNNTPKDTRKIELSVTLKKKKIVINVKDNGAGIAKNNLEKIFDQFITIPTKYSSKGTGIGLYLCKKIVESHQGIITVRSDGLDKGSTFKFSLPVYYST